MMARAMTNPRFVAWLARSTEMPISSFPQQVIVLKHTASATNDEELGQIADALAQDAKQAGGGKN